MEGLLKPIEMIYPINLCACLFNGFFMLFNIKLIHQLKNQV